MIERPSDPAVVQRIRDLCLTLPDVTEKPSHGEPCWFARGRSFATMADHHHDDRLAVWLAAAEGRQESLVETSPQRFFRPPYVGHRGWVGVFLDLPDVDWLEVAALIEDAHRLIGSRRGS